MSAFSLLVISNVDVELFFPSFAAEEGLVERSGV
jgi:hypothetical protein